MARGTSFIGYSASLWAACACLAFATVGLGAAGWQLAGPVDAVAATCEGDECQGPAPAPEDPVPGTAVVEGPANPPVRFPAPRHPQKKHRHHRSKKAKK